MFMRLLNIVKKHAHAKRIWWGKDLVNKLEKQGVIVMCHFWSGLYEEAPGAYKDVSQVVETVHNSKVARKFVRLKPLVTIKVWKKTST